MKTLGKVQLCIATILTFGASALMAQGGEHGTAGAVFAILAMMCWLNAILILERA